MEGDTGASRQAEIEKERVEAWKGAQQLRKKYSVIAACKARNAAEFQRW